MITYKDGQLLIDGKPQLIMCAEIHYYRNDPKDWRNRIERAIECGMNAVATYIPWVCHEMYEGQFDFTGRTNPWLNLKGFIELCQEYGLYLFLRPGPFIMAEMKNEGIPYWVYEKYPEAIPIGFEGAPNPTPTLDYTAPGFLEATKKWYKEIIGLAAAYVYPKGKVIMLQLDNEIGMLSWVTNTPDLTDHVLDGFAKWLENKYGKSKRYPFSFTANQSFYDACRSPKPDYEVYFHQDFARYTRERYAEYLRTLRDYAILYGMKDILFVVNIHGTGHGRGLTYPIGISQLLTAINCEADIISGSDVYYHDVGVPTIADMYLNNEMTAAANKGGRPLTCMEFACGDANYGNDLGVRQRASSTDFRIRLFVAQRNRMINFYIFCGGFNWRLPFEVGDGNDRIANTGETHGYAAPIGPTGIPNQGYERMARVTRQMMAFANKLAICEPVYDNISYGFMVDDYMTEYVYDKATITREIFRRKEQYRANNNWDSTIRALLLLGYAPKVDLIQAEVPKTELLILPSSQYMNRKLQESVVSYLNNGGKLLLQGRLPIYDDEANPCRILADFLEAREIHETSDALKVDRQKHPMITSHGPIDFAPEFLAFDFATCQVERGEVLLTQYETGKVCGFYKKIGKGQVVAITCEYKCNLDVYRKIMEIFDVKSHLTHTVSTPGIGLYSLMTRTVKGEGFLHLINLDDVDKSFQVRLAGEDIAGGREINLPSNDALMLPIDVDFGFGKVKYATIELLRVEENALVFRNTEKFSKICLITSLTPTIEHGRITGDGGEYLLETDNRLLAEEIVVRLV